MNISILPASLCSDPNKMRARLREPLSGKEFFSLLMLAGLIAVFGLHHAKGYYQPPDYKYSYMPAGAGDYSHFFYAYWVVPVFYVLEKMPFHLSYGLWALANVLCTFIAGRVFGGRSWLALLNYQMIYVVFYGQITGLLLGGLALFWWSVSNKKFYTAGLGLLISAIKPQFGLALGSVLWIAQDLTPGERIQTMVVPTLGVLLTSVVYPDWIQNIPKAMRDVGVTRMGDISLWRHLGPWSLLFLIPPLLLPFSDGKRSLLVIVASMFSLPYYQQTGLMALYVLPYGLLSLLGNLGFLFPVLGSDILRWLFVVPFTIYLLMIVRQILELLGSDAAT